MYTAKQNMPYRHFSELGILVGFEFIHLGFDSARFLDSPAVFFLSIGNGLLQIDKLILDSLYPLLKLQGTQFSDPYNW